MYIGGGSHARFVEMGGLKVWGRIIFRGEEEFSYRDLHKDGDLNSRSTRLSRKGLDWICVVHVLNYMAPRSGGVGTGFRRNWRFISIGIFERLDYELSKQCGDRTRFHGHITCNPRTFLLAFSLIPLPQGR